MRPFICAILAAMFPLMTSAQSVPPAIFTDPPTDHAWSDHRIALESTILTWLAGRHQ